MFVFCWLVGGSGQCPLPTVSSSLTLGRDHLFFCFLCFFVCLFVLFVCCWTLPTVSSSLTLGRDHLGFASKVCNHSFCIQIDLINQPKVGRPDPLPGNSNNDLFCDFYGGEEDGLQFGKEMIISSQVSSLLLPLFSVICLFSYFYSFCRDRVCVEMRKGQLLLMLYC